MSDIFREVEEDLRHERLRRVWDRIAPFVIGAAVLVVVGTAGYRGWEAWTTSQAEKAGDAYIAATEAADKGNIEEAEASLDKIANEGSAGYATLARLREAGLKGGSADTRDEAVAEFDAIAADTSIDGGFRDVARLRAGYLLANSGAKRAEIEKRVSVLTADGNPWRHSARELMGLAAYDAGDLTEARRWFETITNDTATPSQAMARARVILSIITSRIGPADDAAKVDSAAAATPAAASDSASSDAMPSDTGASDDGASDAGPSDAGASDADGSGPAAGPDKSEDQ